MNSQELFLWNIFQEGNKGKTFHPAVKMLLPTKRLVQYYMLPAVLINA